MMILVMTFMIKVINVSALDSTNNEVADYYQNSDELYTYNNGEYSLYKVDNESVTIHDYENDLMRVNFILDETSNNTKKTYTSVDDDPITKIIPKNYFTFEGEYCVTGSEYGYYIKTSTESETNLELGKDIYYLSEVFVYDIFSSLKTGLNSTTDFYNNSYYDSVITIGIKPLFQYYYVAVKHNKYMPQEMKGVVKISEDFNDEFMVLPKFDYSYELCSLDNYCLSNIGFTSKLSNSHDYNTNDSNYNIYDDEGMYFISSYVNYIGSLYETENSVVTLNSMVNLLSDLSGFAESIPFVGTAFEVINSAVNGYNLCSDFLTLLEGACGGNKVNCTVFSSDRDYGTYNEFYSKNAEQIKYYGNLIKTEINYLNDLVLKKSDNSDCYTTCNYKISYGKDEIPPTLITSLITFDVSYYYFGNISNVSSQASYRISEIDDEDYSNIYIGDKNVGYNLIGTKGVYRFYSDYNEEFVLSLSKYMNVTIYNSTKKEEISINTIDIPNKIKRYSAYFEKGCVYYIYVGNYDSYNSEYSISLSSHSFFENSIDIELSANSKYVIVLEDMTKECYLLNLNNDNLKYQYISSVEGFKNYRDNYDIDYVVYCENDVSYIVIYNNTTNSISTTVTLESPDSISVDETVSSDNGLLVFYPNDSKGYKIDCVDYKVYPINISNDNTYYFTSDVIYIKYKGSLTITEVSEMYYLIVNGNEYRSNESIYIYNNYKTYEFSCQVRIGDIVLATSYNIKSFLYNSNNEVKINEEDGVLFVKNTDIKIGNYSMAFTFKKTYGDFIFKFKVKPYIETFDLYVTQNINEKLIRFNLINTLDDKPESEEYLYNEYRMYISDYYNDKINYNYDFKFTNNKYSCDLNFPNDIHAQYWKITIYCIIENIEYSVKIGEYINMKEYVLTSDSNLTQIYTKYKDNNCDVFNKSSEYIVLYSLLFNHDLINIDGRNVISYEISIKEQIIWLYLIVQKYITYEEDYVNSDGELIEVIEYILSGVYVITCDIDMDNYDLKTLDVIFDGIIIGNGHSIKNVNLIVNNKYYSNYIGLFAINKGTIKDVIFEKWTLNISSLDTDTYYIGLLCGQNRGTIEHVIFNNCTIKNTNTKITGYVGIIVGKNSGIIDVTNSNVVNSNISKNYKLTTKDSKKWYGYNFGGKLV